jgi:formate dehydrogenase subunit gamma
MQPQGRTWRDVHNDKLAYGGGIYVLGITALIALFLAWRGRIPVAEGESGERLQRFNAFERANHWLTAGSFILMALTGLVILYGNGLIRPWLGASAYSELARVSAWSHMAFAVPFAIGVVVMIFVWIRQNLPERLDWAWLKQGGGFMRNDGNNPPARKFNAGQKIVFWGVALAGLALIVTGVGLMFPFFWSGYTGMQLAQSLHTAIALLLIGLIIGHIYIGTIGMQGAIDAMWSGWVDRNWAKEHHSLWYRTIAPERTSADRAPPPRVRAARSSLAGIGSFATGIVAAIVLSLVMYAIYEQANVRTANSTKNPAVHLDGEFAQGVAPVRK